jgi:uncharacterized protein YjbJ (UPF0337 family)
MEVAHAMKDKLEGKFKEVKGDLTDDKSEQLEGKAQGTMGDVKQTGKELAYDAEHSGDDEEGTV